MLIIKPLEIDNTTRGSTNVVDVEPDWVAAEYDPEDQLIYDGYVYEALTTSSQIPAEAAELAVPTWVKLGAANSWRMFRDGTDSRTSNLEEIDVTVYAATAISTLVCLGVKGVSVRVIVETGEGWVAPDPDVGGGGTPGSGSSGGGGSGGDGTGVLSVVAGYAVNVDDTDPQNPVVSSDFDTDDTASNYTLALVNDNQWMTLTGSGSINITCPPESDVDLGAKFNHVITNSNTGTVTIVAGAGVTVIPPPGGTLVIPANATIGIKKSAYTADTYHVYGPTVAA